MDMVRVGLIGSGFISSIHYEAFRNVRGSEVVAVASPTPGRAEKFAAERAIAHHFTDFRRLLDLKEVDLVVLGIPNDLHCEVDLPGRRSGQARRCRKADGAESRRMRPDDRRLRAGRRHPRLCRRAVFRTQVCSFQSN